MIIDAHVHVFPDQGGPDLGRSRAEQHAMSQACVGDYWGRMVTSHAARRYVPDPDEDVGFEIGAYGRWTWRKHGEDCWLQRGTPMMTQMQHTPEQAIAAMDAAGVDVGIIQTDVEYLSSEYGRERYFADCIDRFGDRLIGTVALDYNLGHDEGFLARERDALVQAAARGFKAVYLSGLGLPEPLEDPRCDALWSEIVRLGLPAYVQTGFCDRNRYLGQLSGLLTVMRRYPDLRVIESHFGGNLVHPDHPNHTDLTEDLRPLLETGRFYLELGYVLGFENFGAWGTDSLYPYARHTEIARALYERHGAAGLVWGSDVPWCYRTCTYQQAVDLVRRHTDYMTKADRSAVLGGNLATLFGLGNRG